MRILCLILGVLALAASGVFVLMAFFGVSGIAGVDVESESVRHIDIAGVLALTGIAWMTASVAFRPTESAPAPAEYRGP